MLNIAIELIGEATSNSLLMFCFCNLIIVMIFAGSSKPNSMESRDSSFTTSVSFNRSNIASDYHYSDDDEKIVLAAISSAQDESLINDPEKEEDRESSHCCDDDDDEMVLASISSAKDESLISDSSVSDDEEDREISHFCDDDDGEGIYAEVEEEEEGDDDLRKRAEEFIAKVNNEWRHEKLKALNLVY